MITGTGLLIAGRKTLVDGLNILNPDDAPWCSLDAKDHRMRRTTWVRQVLLHTTKGDWPQRVIPGAGPGGRAKATADFWRGDPTPSGAHLVVDDDGTVACLADLQYACAYHATVSNEWSVGIEVYQEADNGIHEAALDAVVILVPAICRLMGIPFAVVADPYGGHPIPRFLDGAPDFAGVCGHRNNTEQRGRGDPGDEVFARLIAAGGLPVLAGKRGDVEAAKGRQRWLNAQGAALTVDGIAGPATMATVAGLDIALWRDVPVA